MRTAAEEKNLGLRIKRQDFAEYFLPLPERSLSMCRTVVLEKSPLGYIVSHGLRCESIAAIVSSPPNFLSSEMGCGTFSYEPRCTASRLNLRLPGNHCRLSLSIVTRALCWESMSVCYMFFRGIPRSCLALTVPPVLVTGYIEARQTSQIGSDTLLNLPSAATRFLRQHRPIHLTPRKFADPSLLQAHRLPDPALGG
jgi:hypothetical protein